MELARKKQECVFCNVQFVRRKCLAFFHCVTLVTSIIAIFCHILWKFLSNKMFLKTFPASNASGTKISLVKSFISFHFCQLIHHSHCHIYIHIYDSVILCLSLSIYILYNTYNIYTCVYVFSTGITLVYAHLNWPQLVSLSYLEGGLLVIMIDCMIFLWSFLYLARMSMSSVPFLA